MALERTAIVVALVSAAPLVIHLVRHGVAEGAEGKCIGHAELPLSERGATTIGALGRTWSGPRPAAVVSSDLQRACASAAIITDALGMDRAQMETDARLREMSFGAWEGRAWAEIQKSDSTRMDAWMSAWTQARVPEGEGFPDVRERVAAWADDARNRWRRGEQVIVVAHAGSIRALLSHWLGFTAEQVFQLRVDHGRVSGVELWVDPGGPAPTLLYHNSPIFP